MERENFKSRLGFILVSAGCAIGIGNVWRFPYVAGQNGGGLFVLLYLIFLVLMGVPVLTMELAVGRASRKSAVLGYKKLEKPKSKWHIHGWFCMLGCYLLMMYYTTVSGWMTSYFYKFATGSFESGMTSEQVGGVFNELQSNPLEMVIWMAIITVLGFLVCSRGIQKGIEKVSKVMMIALLILILVLAGNSLFLSGAGEGLSFYLIPDLDKVNEIGLGNVISSAMNCKRKIHEKLVFENAPQNPEAIKGIRAYLLALLSYATMSKRCENADFDLHIDIEGDETLFETEDESAGEIIQKLGNHGGFTIDITCSGKFVNIGNCSDEEFITVACFPDKVPSIFDCLENSGEKDFKYGKIAYFDGIDLWLSQYIDDKTCMDNVFDFGDIVEKKDFAISNLWNSEMFLVIAFDFEKYHDEAEKIKNIIERYIYVDDEKAFKKCRKKWDEEMIIGIDGVQWIPENVGEIVAFTDEINEMLARLDKDEDVGIESYGLFCNMDEFFSAQIYADNEEHCFKVVAVQSVV